MTLADPDDLIFLPSADARRAVDELRAARDPNLCFGVLHPDADVRRATVRALLTLGHDPALDLLVQFGPHFRAHPASIAGVEAALLAVRAEVLAPLLAAAHQDADARVGVGLPDAALGPLPDDPDAGAPRRETAGPLASPPVLGYCGSYHPPPEARCCVARSHC